MNNYGVFSENDLNKWAQPTAQLFIFHFSIFTIHYIDRRELIPMFELSEFYTQSRRLGVDIIPFAPCPAPGATIRDGEHYAIFLDFTKIASIRLMKGVCCHELGHAATGALHRVNSPYETVERSEYRAGRYVAQHFLTQADFAEAFEAGCRELWELSEYFDLPEADVKKALTYWQERQGVDFATLSIDN